MRDVLKKAARFTWRVGRNLLCVTPWGRKLLFPAQSLADGFGRGDAEYAIGVFLHHQRQLDAAGFQKAMRILEVGPGRNLGTSMLMWPLNYRRTGQLVIVFLWDVSPNMVVNAGTLAEVARALLESPALKDVTTALHDEHIDQALTVIAQGEITPDIRHRVQPLSALMASGEANVFDLVDSQAAIEHIWHLADFWRRAISLTGPGGWHSHRIDLAAHGRREANNIEMLEWSPLGYWLTMRFIPGAISRWCAALLLDFLRRSGLKILSVEPETRDSWPIRRSRIDRRFRALGDVVRALGDVDLRTTAVDLIAVKVA